MQRMSSIMCLITCLMFVLLLAVPAHTSFQNPTLSTIFSKTIFRNNGIISPTKLYDNYIRFDYNQFISDLFLSEKDLDSMKTNEKVISRGTIEKFTRKWTVANEKTPHVCSNTKTLSSSSCTPCCETLFTADIPYTVQYGGKYYKVVHPSDGYQVIFQGICQNGTACNYGTCVEEKNYYTWVLVEDASLNYYPPIRFVPVQYSKMCACVNIGT